MIPARLRRIYLIFRRDGREREREREKERERRGRRPPDGSCWVF
jgi:hypothetical protein